jgi:hypothetical protein
MNKTLLVVALSVSVIGVAALIPATSEAFMSPVGKAFSTGWSYYPSGYYGGCYSGCGYSGGYGYYGRPYSVGFGKHFGRSYVGYGPYYGWWGWY